MLQEFLTALPEQLGHMIGASVHTDLPRIVIRTPQGCTTLQVDATERYVTDEHGLNYSLAGPSIARISALFAWQPVTDLPDDDVRLLQEKIAPEFTTYVSGLWPYEKGTIRGVRTVHTHSRAQRHGTLISWVSAGILHALLELEDPTRPGTARIEYMERDLTEPAEPF